jgi:MFS family permease
VGLATAANAFGLIFGPFIGEILFQYWSWKGNFLGFALIMSFWALMIMVLVPNNLNHSDIKNLKTRYDSRYSFQSIIIEGSEEVNSSVRSNSMQDLFDSMYRN